MHLLQPVWWALAGAGGQMPAYRPAGWGHAVADNACMQHLASGRAVPGFLTAALGLKG